MRAETLRLLGNLNVLIETHFLEESPRRLEFLEDIWIITQVVEQGLGGPQHLFIIRLQGHY